MEYHLILRRGQITSNRVMLYIMRTGRKDRETGDRRQKQYDSDKKRTQELGLLEWWKLVQIGKKCMIFWARKAQQVGYHKEKGWKAQIKKFWKLCMEAGGLDPSHLAPVPRFAPQDGCLLFENCPQITFSQKVNLCSKTKYIAGYSCWRN